MNSIKYNKRKAKRFKHYSVRIDYIMQRGVYSYRKEGTGRIVAVYITGLRFKVDDCNDSIFINYTRIKNIELAFKNRYYYKNKV